MACEACKNDPERQALVDALRKMREGAIPGLAPIPRPDEDPLLNSGNRKQDEKLEKWMRRKRDVRWG